jgi:hypothetical protein
MDEDPDHGGGKGPKQGLVHRALLRDGGVWTACPNGMATNGKLRLGEQFAYVFDLGDNWQRLCTVADGLADPLETLGIIPDRPLPWWSWGSIPDQYGRDWNGDDGETPPPLAPDGLTDLPPILPWWGPQPWQALTAPPDPAEDGIRYRDLTDVNRSEHSNNLR